MTDLKGHPHAELMILYGERSRKNAREFENWEYHCRYGWQDLSDTPQWNEDFEYRLRMEPVKPKTLYAVIDVQSGRVTYYGDEDEACQALHYLRAEAMIEKYIQVLE